MRLSQFQELLREEFGTQFSEVLLRDIRLTELRDQTPQQLIVQGEDPKAIWLAICKEQGVPKERWSVAPARKRHAD
ncbi:DUF3046 domain-containing protein [Aquiluna borgnonia]|uniref:DUF3046 domain-containing protein n=1 Tax=Aquiluna borgnonia TaxID=2499157 RepID=A0A7D4Q4A0_9MICO|nr:DUF3046 domain-containing protein [Aquiluna borgnonia]QKJ25449.1 DUF3046 domain-containing protein [Aquiluna borgnonia]